MTYKTKYIALLVISACLFVNLTSCNKEPIGFSGSGIQGKGVKISFNLTLPDPKKIERRAVVDDALSSVYLLVFDNDNKFIEWSKANENSDAAYNFIATLTEQTQICNIYVVANTPTIITQLADSWTAGVTDLQDVKNDLIKPSMVRPGEDFIRIGSIPETPPMISETPIIGTIQKSMTIDPIAMVRAMAKITINESLINFEVDGATLCNAPLQGYVFPNMDYSTIAVNDYYGQNDNVYSLGFMNRRADVGEPLYCYESDMANNTFVIIKASYNNIGGYYKVNLKDTDGTQLALQRNYWYQININKVQTPGYRTAAEARNNTALNDLPGNDVTVEVSDGYSHDIASNGSYYLGVENSEFIIYSTEDLTNILVTKVQCNAPQSVLVGAVSFRAYNSVGSETTSGVSVSNPFNTNNGLVQSGDLKITMPKGITSVDIQLRVGNLERTLRVERRSDNLAFGDAIEFEGAYMWGRVAGKSTSYSWLGLSDDENTEHHNGTDYIESSSGAVPFYLILSSNLIQNTVHEDRNATLFLARANDKGRTKVVIYQPTFDIFQKASSPIQNPYVGAFWRYNETGERVIHMRDVNGNTVKSASTWVVDVVYGREWIKLLAGGSEDPSIYTSNPSSAENYQIYNNAKAKNVIVGSGDIVFRIGLKSSIQPNDHRYGVVLLHHSGGTERIFIRQGESPDFLFDKDAPTLNSWSNSAWNSTPRPMAVKMSPYNLSDPNLGRGASFYGLHNSMPLDYHSENIATSTFNKNKFTQYPSQAGYFFIWNAKEQPMTNSQYHNGTNTVSFNDEWQWIKAVHPIKIGNIWGNNSADPPTDRPFTGINTYLGDYCGNGNRGVPRYGSNSGAPSYSFSQVDRLYTNSTNPCPLGYRLPSVGKVNLSSPYQTKYSGEDAYYSEIGQSMLYDPKMSNTSLSTYMLWGYYADGFFDRLPISTPQGSVPYSMAVKGDLNSATGNDIAYAGSLLFNPNNYSSIFHPASGFWSSSLLSQGSSYNYWTQERLYAGRTSAQSNPGIGLCLVASKTGFYINSGAGDESYPKSIRCVRDYQLEGEIVQKNYN